MSRLEGNAVELHLRNTPLNSHDRHIAQRIGVYKLALWHCLERPVRRGELKSLVHHIIS